MAFHVSVGDQLFLEEGGDEIGAVREVASDHLVVYIEASGDFVVPGAWVRAAHDGKVVLDRTKIDNAALLSAAAHAHDDEMEPAREHRRT
jgi:hypothetical protein